LKNKVSLQISLAPGDYPHARYILKHQLNVLASQVDEIILIVDTRHSKGRFGEGWARYKEQLYKFIQTDIEGAYSIKIIPVDYSAPIKKQVAGYFFGTSTLPDKDFRGGPFYAYFFGLFMAANNLVFHLDSDMFLGGASPIWVAEAIRFFDQDNACFIVSPLPGPPHHDDILLNQPGANKIAPYTWQFKGMSTRIFLIDKTRFKTNKLTLKKPPARNQVKAFAQGNPNADLPEHLLSAYMHKYQLKRMDFLGTGTGLWSLHPPYRTGTFYSELPQLISSIELNHLPEKQQGFYDIIDEVCNWTEAREKLKNNRWWKIG
jgi:hypothetical protein